MGETKHVWYTEERLMEMGYRPAPDKDMWFRYVQGKPRFINRKMTIAEVDEDFQRGNALNETHIRKPFLNMYYDAEFTGLHRETTLISLGMVSESGNHFYAEFTDYGKNFVNDWIQKHVIDNLMFNDQEAQFFDEQIELDRYGLSIDAKGSSEFIRKLLLRWLKHEADINLQKIQIKTDCYAYDWMLLVDLLTNGRTALDMPELIHYIPIDLSTMLYAAGVDPDVNREEFAGDMMGLANKEAKFLNAKHNSLWDAYVIAKCFYNLNHHIIPNKLGVITVDRLLDMNS